MRFIPFVLLGVAVLGVIVYRKHTASHVSLGWLNEQELQSFRNRYEGVSVDWQKRRFNGETV